MKVGLVILILFILAGLGGAGWKMYQYKKMADREAIAHLSSRQQVYDLEIEVRELKNTIAVLERREQYTEKEIAKLESRLKTSRYGPNGILEKMPVSPLRPVTEESESTLFPPPDLKESRPQPRISGTINPNAFKQSLTTEQKKILESERTRLEARIRGWEDQLAKQEKIWQEEIDAKKTLRKSDASKDIIRQNVTRSIAEARARIGEIEAKLVAN